MMERLTKRAPGYIMFDSPSGEAISRLASYEDLEEQGRLATFPCSIGESAYFIVNKRVMCGRCRKISIHFGGMQITFDDKDGEPWTVGVKNVYSSRAEAEKAMEVSG